MPIAAPQSAGPKWRAGDWKEPGLGGRVSLTKAGSDMRHLVKGTYYVSDDDAAPVLRPPPLGIEMAGFHRPPGKERRIAGIRQPTAA